MPRLPAFCRSCGAVYPSPLRADGPRMLTSMDLPVPCPACGKSGHVPPEILRRLVELAEIVRDPDFPPAAASALTELAREARERAPPIDDFRARLLDRDAELRAVVPLLPAEDGDLPPFLALVLAVAAEAREAGPGTPPVEIAAAAVERAVDRHGVRPETAGEPEEGPRARAGTGRNDPCPCGSGRKYKDCHWLEDLRARRD